MSESPPPTRVSRLKATIEAWSPRTWPITIAIALCILGVAIYNLYLLHTANRPQLVATESRLSINPNANPPEFVFVSWGNMGKQSAHRGTAIFHTMTEKGDDPPTRLAMSEISNGRTTTLVPTFGYASAMVVIDMSKFLGVFLVCTQYFDDYDKPYHQEFLFRRGDKQPDGIIPLIELPPAKRSHCE